MPAWTMGVAVAILAVFLMIPAALAATRLLTRRPDAVSQDGKYELYSLPGWSLRSVGADAMLVFSDETGWLGHGMGKYVKDKGDYGLDQKILDAAPIEPGEAKAFAVKRLPVDHLIVTNIYDERKLTSRESLQHAVANAFTLASNLGCTSAVLFDPTDDWNYYAKRLDAAAAAELLKHALHSSEGKLSTIKVVVTNPDHLSAYKAAFA